MILNETILPTVHPQDHLNPVTLRPRYRMGFEVRSGESMGDHGLDTACDCAKSMGDPQRFEREINGTDPSDRRKKSSNLTVLFGPDGLFPGSFHQSQAI